MATAKDAKTAEIGQFSLRALRTLRLIWLLFVCNSDLKNRCTGIIQQRYEFINPISEVGNRCYAV